MMRPGGSPRPRNGAATLPVLPVTADMLTALAQAIAGGVTDVQYADRRVQFMSLSDLMRAYEWVATQLGLGGYTPVRRVAVFSKGLYPYYGTIGAAEGVEIADALWSRQIERPPGLVDDVDWERR